MVNMSSQTTNHRSAFAAVVGRPSSGKSTLMNAICGHKVSIVAEVPQTTRNRIRGIYTEARGQLVFVDTPGYHDSERKFNLALRELIDGSLSECDMVLYLVDSSRRPGAEERALAAKLAECRLPILVAISKIDLLPKESADQRIAELTAFVNEYLPQPPVLPLCAHDGTGIPELLDALFEKAPEGPIYYPEEFYTDQEPRFRIAELVREQVLKHTRQELPHAVYVLVDDATIDEERNELQARCFIYVERESQKGIVVGSGGRMIRKIRQAAEAEAGLLFDQRVVLDIRVKVHPRWRRRANTLSRLVY